MKQGIASLVHNASLASRTCGPSDHLLNLLFFYLFPWETYRSNYSENYPCHWASVVAQW